MCDEIDRLNISGINRKVNNNWMYNCDILIISPFNYRDLEPLQQLLILFPSKKNEK
ncbi:hypothetical protein C1645_834516 [Glomus cerebriforme]|uniref:Uncharacterized protein n=1 Tax=Glomus cerebriforme TaxID=658196 RepID=A0A397SDL8_9GLOM|nr:hypothetical protein C1645_834516 [Glomus cerebriforme]